MARAIGGGAGDVDLVGFGAVEEDGVFVLGFGGEGVVVIVTG